MDVEDVFDDILSQSTKPTVAQLNTKIAALRPFLPPTAPDEGIFKQVKAMLIILKEFKKLYSIASDSSISKSKKLIKTNWHKLRPDLRRRPLINVIWNAKKSSDIIQSGIPSAPKGVVDIINDYASVSGSGKSKSNSWVDHVKAYRVKHKVSYKEAMKKASASYKR